MSQLVVPIDGKKRTLAAIAGDSLQQPANIDLYKNNVTPVAASVIGDFTVADFSGYAQGTMGGAAVDAALDGSNRAVCEWDPFTWTKNGATGNTIFGYFVTNAAGDLLWAEKFDSSIAMTVDGAFITITPKLTNKSQFSNS